MGMETARSNRALYDFVLFAPRPEYYPRVAAVSAALLQAADKSEVAAAPTPSDKEDAARRVAASRLLARNRAARIAAPLAPRTGIESGARESRNLHGEQVVARRDAGAALMHDAMRLCRTEQF